ncbi:hypothetical protein Tco_1070784 [Tanacetum coccineum]|uniref:Uncharacterized protein n=1 Tax=Tanacetum coccineum TaxID=301880 RepID=A0ABQ5HP70_9ASTR
MSSLRNTEEKIDAGCVNDEDKVLRVNGLQELEHETCRECRIYGFGTKRLEINFLLKGPQPAPRVSSTHVHQAYAEAVSSNSHPRNLNKPPRQNFFTFHERVCPNPQPQALGTNFEARVRDYMAAQTERMERFENAIFKQREEINDRMTEMFGLLKELTASITPEKVLIREDARHPVTKNVNSISLIRGEEEKSAKDNAMFGDSIEKPDGSDAVVPLKEVKKENKAKNGTKIEPVESPNKKLTQIEEEESVEAPSSQSRLTDERPAETDIRLSLASHSYIYSLGIAEDVLVDVAAKAVIKFDKGMITLRSRKSKISFHIILETLCRIEKGTKNDIEPIAPTMTVNSKIFNNERPTPVKEECEVKNEGGVTLYLMRRNPKVLRNFQEDDSWRTNMCL